MPGAIRHCAAALAFAAVPAAFLVLLSCGPAAANSGAVAASVSAVTPAASSTVAQSCANCWD